MIRMSKNNANNNNKTVAINVRQGNEVYNGHSDAELESLVEERLGQIASERMPDNQEGMPSYCYTMESLHKDLARLYRKLRKLDLANEAEGKADGFAADGKSWSKALYGYNFNNNNGSASGGRRRGKRGSRKARRSSRKTRRSRKN